MRKAINIQPGDEIADFGEVKQVYVSHRDVANKEARPKSEPVVLPKFINGLVRARMAAEAVEQCYRQEPALVTVINGTKSLKFKPNALVKVVEPLKVAA